MSEQNYEKRWKRGDRVEIHTGKADLDGLGVVEHDVDIDDAVEEPLVHVRTRGDVVLHNTRHLKRSVRVEPAASGFAEDVDIRGAEGRANRAIDELVAEHQRIVGLKNDEIARLNVWIESLRAKRPTVSEDEELLLQVVRENRALSLLLQAYVDDKKRTLKKP